METLALTHTQLLIPPVLTLLHTCTHREIPTCAHTLVHTYSKYTHTLTHIYNSLPMHSGTHTHTLSHTHTHNSLPMHTGSYSHTFLIMCTCLKELENGRGKCVCVGERENVCVFERERESVCVFERERERECVLERERESVCVCE